MQADPFLLPSSAEEKMGRSPLRQHCGQGSVWAVLCSMTGIVLSHSWRAPTHCDYQQSKDFTNQPTPVTCTKFSHPGATRREPLYPFQGELHVDKYNPAATGWQRVGRSLPLCPIANHLPPFPVHNHNNRLPSDVPCQTSA